MLFIVTEKNYNVKMINRPSSNISSNSPSLLRVMYERPVNTLATENGDCLIDQDILASQKNDFTCYYCGEKRSSRVGRINHERKHRREIAKEKRRKAFERRKDHFSIYTCEECFEQFSKKVLLTKHMKKHIKEIECIACHRKFKDKMDFEWHDAIDDGLNYGKMKTPVHRTRSQSRLSCRNIIQSSKRSQSCVPTLISYTPISEISNERINGHFNFKRKRSPSFSHFSAKSTPYKRIRSSQYNKYNSEESSDDDNGDFRGSIVSSNMTSPAASGWSNYAAMVFNYNNPFQCSETNCLKPFGNLDSLTLHEIADHNKLALFRCKECRKRFTTSQNLKQHKAENHPIQVLCVLCDILQQGLEIESHAHMHRKSSIICEICGKQFLNNYTLEEHLKKPLTHRIKYPRKIDVLIRTNTGEPRKTFTHHFEACESDFSFGELCIDYFENKSETVNELKVHLPWRS